MLNSSGLPPPLWAEAVNTAVHILNRIPTSAKPYIMNEKYFGCKPSLKNLRTFGQPAVANKPLVHRNGKWDTTGNRMRFVGYTSLYNTYRFFDPKKNKIVITCNAIFLDEEQNPIILSGSTHEIQDQPDINVIEYIGPKNQKGVA